MRRQYDVNERGVETLPIPFAENCVFYAPLTNGEDCILKCHYYSGSQKLYKGDTLYCNGYYTQSTSVYDGKTLVLFNNFIAGVNSIMQNGFCGALNYMKIWQANVLVRDFVPALRNSDGRAGLIDLLTGQFYTNMGTSNYRCE